ncbi:MAG: VanZ family protein [Rhodocyclaceae bacterium]|jgi:VanZ family protein|nr:VanZ family protein [Rhodocyclaceae bacterium]
MLTKWWLLYVVFVIYGSLVPLDFRPMPWEAAWQAFGRIHLLNVGAAGRADWVANGVLYVPVGFLTASLLAGRGAAIRAGAAVGALGWVALLALAVEFAQVFFPPRTVSLNDLFAEFVGGGLGVGIAVVAADRLRRLVAAWMEGVERFAPRLLKLYALAYVAFSFFPFDFLLSAGEWADKLASDRWGWLWASAGGRGGAAAGVAKLMAEALAAAPLGWLLARRGWGPGRALGAGAVLGAVIELGQFCLVSGVAQGFSVLTRAAGVAAGALAWGRRGRLDPLVVAGAIRRHGLVAVVVYLVALVAVTGWFELPWRGWAEAFFALEEVRFLPFYYHYYTTEQAALLSLTSVCLMYAPVGLLAWAFFFGPGLAAILAALLAGLMEVSKLFLVGLHPDPTNLLVAGVAAWLACRLARGAEGLAHRAGRPEVAGAAAEVQRSEVGMAAAPDLATVDPVGTPGPWRRPGARGWMGLAAVGVLAAGWVLSFPFQPLLLGLGFAVYGVVLWQRPHWLWVAVPAALALLDLAPWSGRFFFDEFDLLLVVSLGVGYARLGPVPAGQRDWLWRLALGLVALVYGIGVARGLLPWQGLDANSFSHYYSPFNALRIAKGAAWALLLVGLAGRFAAAGWDVGRLFGQGMVVGLAGTTAVVIWERWAFPGLFNFTDVYRVTGPFSQMNTGGADLEGYLAAAVPFLVWALFEGRRWQARMLGLVLLAASTYAMMVTFSRAGYGAFCVAAGLTALFALVRRGGPGRLGWLKRGLGVVLVVALVGAVAAPVLMGGFAQARLARVGQDLDVRIDHWRDALAMRDPGLATALFGMGLGRFPVTHFWRSDEVRAASYQIGQAGPERFLRLGTGSPVYVEQGVSIQPGQDYGVSLRVRSPQEGGRIAVSLCEKWLLTSARCVFAGQVVGAGGDWRAVSLSLPSGDVGAGFWYKARPVKLSLYNAGQGAVVDVDDVRLIDRDGQDLLTNGGFQAGMDRWFFSADVDLPWHIWSLPVAVLFEMGWVGVLALGWAGLLAFGRAGLTATRGNLIVGAWLAAFLGLGLLGVVDSFGDSCRVLLLWLFVMSFMHGIKTPAQVVANGPAES